MSKNRKRHKTATPVDRAKYAPEVVMANWRALMEAIIHMGEDELHAALMFEVARPRSDRRGDFIKRLFHKYNRLRGERELKEYMP